MLVNEEHIKVGTKFFGYGTKDVIWEITKVKYIFGHSADVSMKCIQGGNNDYYELFNMYYNVYELVSLPEDDSVSEYDESSIYPYIERVNKFL